MLNKYLPQLFVTDYLIKIENTMINNYWVRFTVRGEIIEVEAKLISTMFILIRII